MPSLFVSAAHKSSGKTTLALGLSRALRARGRSVQVFKKGPDYIDPIWHALASGRPAYNLDFRLMRPAEIDGLFARHAAAADLCLVEGNKGLYDGMDVEGSDSNAALAKRLGLPVLLVIDTGGITRGVAPLLIGYRAFDPQVRIAGVILNKVGGPRHEEKLRRVIERYTDIPVIGAVARDPRLAIEERHLGLVPGNEAEAAEQRIETIAAAVAAQVDLDALTALAAAASPPPVVDPVPPVRRPRTLRIAIARDRAFGFYYSEDLDQLVAQGAELVNLDCLCDGYLPEVDGLIIGGGFPESFLAELSANGGLRAAIAAAVDAGLPVYAECGGLMYLARSIRWGERAASMVGILPGDVVMTPRPVGRGYASLVETGASPFSAGSGRRHAAHEFHHSRLENLAPDLAFAYEVARGHGIDGRHDGFVYRNLLATYCHRRGSGPDGWIGPFLAKARDYARQRHAARIAA